MICDFDWIQVGLLGIFSSAFSIEWCIFLETIACASLIAYLQIHPAKLT